MTGVAARVSENIASQYGCLPPTSPRADLTFAILLTFTPRWQMLAPEHFSRGLILEPVVFLALWSASSLLWELRQLAKEGSVHAYYADRLCPAHGLNL